MSKQNHIPHLDGWRGIAILVVLLSHFTAPFQGGGTFGVDLFFALSGYLICGQLFIEHIPLDIFFERRFARVYPAFFIFTCAMFVYMRFWPSSHYVVPSRELFYTLTFLRTYLPLHNSIWAEKWPVGHIWSLNVEEHSYIWLALGAALSRNLQNPRIVAGFFLLSVLLPVFFIVYYASCPQGQDQSPFYLHTECASLGLLAAAAYRLARHQFRFLKTARPRYFPLAFLILGLCFYSEEKPLGFAAVLTPLCLAIAINHMSESYNWILKALSQPILCWFGLCSFSIYLWQEFFYTPTAWSAALWEGFSSTMRDNPLAEDIYGILAVLAATLLGAASYYLIENPLRSRLNNRSVSTKAEVI